MAYEKAKPLVGIDLNYEVVGGTTAPTTFNKENIIWVNTNAVIGEHCFSLSEPTYYSDSLTQTITYNQKWSVESAYLSNTGAVVTGDAYWNITAYIDISKAKQISYTGVTFIEDNRTNICFYDSSQTLLSIVKMATGTNTIDAPSNAHFFRMCVRKNDKTDYQTLVITVVNQTLVSDYDIWIQTDIDNTSIGFNAVKRNEIMIYPKKIKQWKGSYWKALDGTLYKNGTSIQTYEGQIILLNGQTLTNGVTAIDTRGSLNGNYGYNPLTISSSGVTINTTTGNGNQRNSLMTLTPKINLTEYSTITFYFSTFSVTSMKSGDKFRVGVTTSAASNLSDYAMRSGTYKEWSSPSTLTTEDYGPQTYTVDISSLSGEYYVYWDCQLKAQYSSSSDGWPGVNFTLNKIYLE